NQMLLSLAERKIEPLISRRVEVRSEGDWYKARVIDARGSSYRVHYFGYEDSDDEWVSLRQIRNLRTQDYTVGVRGESVSEGDGGAPRNSNERPWRLSPRRQNDGRWDDSVIRNPARPEANSNRNNPVWQ